MTETLCPTLLDRRILPLAELLALCLDGQLYRVGESFATTDTPDTPALRAQALAATVPRRAIAERGTAAWIHGTRSSPPPRPQICLDPSRRGTRVPVAVDGRQRTLKPGEARPIGPIAVTTPLRTAADLLLSAPVFDEPEALEVRHLLALDAAMPESLARFVPRTRRGGSVRALQRIRSVERARLPLIDAGARDVSPR
ncbi:hypothetical protein ACFVU2_10565 [Leifsonia sp. NPDC058194]|uniref:hypothetical protein n=1 Tax=Leifsonia sp. NPDC058194 TaxID=3346374 RepID=UPI0036DCE0D7